MGRSGFGDVDNTIANVVGCLIVAAALIVFVAFFSGRKPGTTDSDGYYWTNEDSARKRGVDGWWIRIPGKGGRDIFVPDPPTPERPR